MLRERRNFRKTRGLSEESLIDKFLYGSSRHPGRSVNGVRFYDFTDASSQQDFLPSAVAQVSGTGANILIMLLELDAVDGIYP